MTWPRSTFGLCRPATKPEHKFAEFLGVDVERGGFGKRIRTRQGYLGGRTDEKIWTWISVTQELSAACDLT